jgi:hypothetical protein
LNQRALLLKVCTSPSQLWWNTYMMIFTSNRSIYFACHTGWRPNWESNDADTRGRWFRFQQLRCEMAGIISSPKMSPGSFDPILHAECGV